MSKRIFFPYLDTLRFFAFFMVFIGHVFRDYQIQSQAISARIINFCLTLSFHGGGEGVNIFFVLSGFLITYLLVAESNETGRISVWHFYVRRALRIWPLYYLIFFLGLFILPHVFPETFPADQSKLLGFTFLVNFDPVINTDKMNPAFAVAWSVAIEEQFYLVFPLYYLLLFSYTRLYYIITAVIICCSLFFLYHADHRVQTAVNVCFLMIGSIGAYHINHGKDRIGLIPFVRKYSKPILALTLAVLFIRAWASNSVHKWGFNIGLLCSGALGFLYLLVIIRICFGDPLHRVFNITSRLGIYSYGFYFYHQMIIFIIRACFDRAHLDYHHSLGLLSVIGITAFASTLIIGYLSYTYYEKFFLRFKYKFATVIAGKR